MQDVIDGDLCEQFSLLSADKQRSIAQELERTPSEVLKKLEVMRNSILWEQAHTSGVLSTNKQTNKQIRENVLRLQEEEEEELLFYSKDVHICMWCVCVVVMKKKKKGTQNNTLFYIKKLFWAHN